MSIVESLQVAGAICLKKVLGPLFQVLPCNGSFWKMVTENTPEPVHSMPDIHETAPDMLTQPPELTKVMLILLSLIIGLFLMVWLVKRGFLGKFRKVGGKGQIQITEIKPISPKTVLYLVEVRGKTFLMAESQLEVKRIGDVEIAVSDDDK